MQSLRLLNKELDKTLPMSNDKFCFTKRPNPNSELIKWIEKQARPYIEPNGKTIRKVYSFIDEEWQAKLRELGLEAKS